MVQKSKIFLLTVWIRKTIKYWTTLFTKSYYWKFKTSKILSLALFITQCLASVTFQQRKSARTFLTKIKPFPFKCKKNLWEKPLLPSYFLHMSWKKCFMISSKLLFCQRLRSQSCTGWQMTMVPELSVTTIYCMSSLLQSRLYPC